jgi:O-antigen/teichoic acid export membrane protein
MRAVHRIVKNTGVLVVSQIGASLLALIYGIYTPRYLGPESFGVLSFAIAFTAIFSVFTELGFSSLIVREIAKDKSQTSKYLGNIALIKLFLTVITFGLIALTVNLLGYPEQTIKVVYLLGLSVVCKAFSGMFDSTSQAHERLEYNSIGLILNNSLMLGGILFAISQRFNVVGFAFVYFFSSAVSLAYSFSICVWKFAKPKLEIDWIFWKSIIKEALPFGLTTIFVTNFQWISSVMLSAKGDAAVGWYSAAYRLAFIPLLIPATFMTAVYPVMSNFSKNSLGNLKFSLEKSFKYLTTLGIPIGVGTTLLAQRFILTVFKAEYTNSIIILQILIWASVFIFMDNAFASMLNSTNKQAIITKTMGFCLVFNVVLNLILIPKYGIVGASITTVLTQFTALVLILIGSSRSGYSVFTKVFMSIIIRAIISSALMGVFIMCFYNLTLWLLVIFAVLVYFVTLYLIGGIDEGDIKLFNIVVRRK